MLGIKDSLNICNQCVFVKKINQVLGTIIKFVESWELGTLK